MLTFRFAVFPETTCSTSVAGHSWGDSFFNLVIYWLHSLYNFHQMYKNMKGLTTSVKHIIKITLSHSRNDLVYSLSNFIQSLHKTDSRSSVIGGYLLRLKSGFIFVRLFNFKSDISLKLNKELDRFI